MGKANDDYTPEQRALLKKMAGNYTPEQRAALQKKQPAKTPEQRAKLGKGRRLLDLYIANRDNQIPPPWTERPTPTSEAAGKGKDMARVRPLVCEMFPPDGIAPDGIKTVDVVRAVQKIFPDIKRDVIARAIGRRKT